MLTEAEKSIIKEFQNDRIPSIYKLDYTDNILFVEHVMFDICRLLLRGKKVSQEIVQEEINEYSRFLSQITISALDEVAKANLKLLMTVINIFIKYNL